MLGTAVITDTLTVFAQCIRNLLFSSFKITGTKRFFLECIRNRLLKHTRKEAVKNHMTASLACIKNSKLFEDLFQSSPAQDRTLHSGRHMSNVFEIH